VRAFRCQAAESLAGLKVIAMPSLQQLKSTGPGSSAKTWRIWLPQQPRRMHPPARPLDPTAKSASSSLVRSPTSVSSAHASWRWTPGTLCYSAHNEYGALIIRQPDVSDGEAPQMTGGRQASETKETGTIVNPGQYLLAVGSPLSDDSPTPMFPGPIMDSSGTDISSDIA
jgi:hypothetical protein